MLVARLEAVSLQDKQHRSSYFSRRRKKKTLPEVSSTLLPSPTLSLSFKRPSSTDAFFLVLLSPWILFI